jgi:hypothetical protein
VVPVNGDRIAQVSFAVADGTYPGVWANEGPDPAFGITSPIFLDEMTTVGTVVNTIPVTGMVTSFSSKSELGLNQSVDGSVVTFMGYKSPINTIDVSNSNTPGHIDPTDAVATIFQRGIAQVDSTGNILVTPVNAYSGNNGRAAIAANGLYYLVGNAGNGSGTEPLNIINNTGVQATTPGGNPETTVIGQQRGTCPPPSNGNGCQFGFSITDIGLTADKSGKDDNFRGVTIFDNTLYVTKGSGSNGVNTVYQVGSSGTLPTLATASTTPITILPGLPNTLARATTPAPQNPFGIWFANATTLYVADEGNGNPGNTDPAAGLQKWVFDGTTWNPKYTMQSGLNLGVSYHVAGYDPSLDPSPAGLRNLTGRLNDDGTVTIWAITSTTSANTDQGADPNQLVVITDNLSNVDPAVGAAESFTLLRTAQFGEVLRGVSFTAGTINPVWSTSIKPTPNANGWNNTDADVTLMATQVQGGVQSIHYTLSGAQTGGQTVSGNSADVLINKEGVTTISYFAQNVAGSRSSAPTLDIKVDKTAPAITFSGNAGSYTIDQLVAITCTATDAVSGIASSTCPGASGPADGFHLGANQLQANAMDKAGNSSALTTSFTVSVTFDSLAALTNQFISQHGIANSLTAKLSAAAAAAARGDMNAEAAELNAYANEVSAQTGKALTASQAAILTKLAAAF